MRKAPETIVIHGELTLKTRPAWEAKIVARIAGKQEVVLDLSQVSRIDTAGLLMLITIRRRLVESAGQCHIQSDNPDIQKILVFSRLSRLLPAAVGLMESSPQLARA